MGRARAARWKRRGGNLDLAIALAIAALLIAWQVWRHFNPEPAPTIAGRARVVDGDTIDIGRVRIRLAGIDAPEFDQPCTDPSGETWPCGRAAARELRGELLHQDLTCAARGLDAYGRVLAVCSLPAGADIKLPGGVDIKLPGGVDINAWMVRQGWAVASGFAPSYHGEESEARAARRGIWSGSFVPPRQWRARRQ